MPALMARAAISAESSGSQIEYHHCGTPMPGEVSSKRKSSHTTRVLMTVLSARVLWDDVRYGETSPGIGVPQWWYTMWLPIISAAITLRAIGLLRRGGRAAADNVELPTSPEVRAEEHAP